MKRIFPAINAIIAIAAGIIVLLGYFITNIPVLLWFRILLLQWSVLLAGIAVIVGVGNLFSVHYQKITQRKPGALYSLVLLVFFLLTFVVIVTVNSNVSQPDFQDVMIKVKNMLLNGIMVPIEISLMALLTVTLLYSGARMLRSRVDLKTILFLVAVLLGLLSIGPFASQIPFLSNIIQTISTGGARGLLIGVALGTLTTGLRILLGADRPYGGK